MIKQTITQERQQLLYLAHIACEIGRHEDLFEAVTKIIEINSRLKEAQKRYFLVGIKEVVASRKSSLRMLNYLQIKEMKGLNFDCLTLLKMHRKSIESEIRSFCNKAIQLIDNNLLPLSINAENHIFYLTLKIDILKFIQELAQGQQMLHLIQQIGKTYDMAIDLSTNHLNPRNPLKLRVFLNHSLFLKNVRNSLKSAIKQAQSAQIDASSSNLESQDECSMKETKDLLDLIRQNLNVWKSELKTDENDFL